MSRLPAPARARLRLGGRPGRKPVVGTTAPEDHRPGDDTGAQGPVPGSRGIGDDVRAALPGWVAARLVVLGALALVHVLAAKVDASVPGYTDRLSRGLLAWDGRWYFDIAERGYAALPDESLRFFPLYPLGARALSPVVAGHTGLALLLVSNAAALALGALVHRLALEETGDPALARRAAWLVALVPPFYVLVMGYGEPLALALSVACFLALRRRRWGWAAVAGFFAGLTRPVGAILSVPAAVEAARGLRSAPARERVGRVLAVMAPLAGVGSFLVWVGVRFDRALLPLEVQNRAHLRGGFANPVVTVVRATGDLFQGDVGLGENSVHLPWVVLAAVLAVVVCRRWPASYAAFTVATLVVALSATDLGSFERYAFGAFPLVLALASVTAAAWAERLVLSVSASLLAGFAALALLLYYVP